MTDLQNQMEVEESETSSSSSSSETSLPSGTFLSETSSGSSVRHGITSPREDSMTQVKMKVT